MVIGNYTYSRSRLNVEPGDLTAILGVTSPLATDYFRDEAPMTGQSDHVGNLELSLESPDKLSQQTLLLSYASKRVVSRGLNGSPAQPDIIEVPGLRGDFVAREGIRMFNREIELKFEARNLTGRKHVEYQRAGDNQIDVNTYDVGRLFALSASIKFGGDGGRARPTPAAVPPLPVEPPPVAATQTCADGSVVAADAVFAAPPPPPSTVGGQRG